MGSQRGKLCLQRRALGYFYRKLPPIVFRVLPRFFRVSLDLGKLRLQVFGQLPRFLVGGSARSLCLLKPRRNLTMARLQLLVDFAKGV